MSLDVYLNKGVDVFDRDIQQYRTLTIEEWVKAFPTLSMPEGPMVFQRNITHNLGLMAEAAGVYKALWRPEEIDCTYAGQLIPILKEGLRKLKVDPIKYKAMNPHNGWGDYEGLMEFVKTYLNACREYPEATIKVSR